MNTPRSYEIRNRLTGSALQFFHLAGVSLAADPRTALVHLCSGLELMLKARLAHEHWSLVVDQPGTKSYAEIQSGDFKSVGFQDALKRLEKITGLPRGQDAALLASIAGHRNKVMHFYHPDFEGEAKLRTAVAQEQCRAWALAKRLMEGAWSAAFPEIGASAESVNRVFAGNRTYLEVQFEDAKPRLNISSLKGAWIRSCGACGFDAVVCEPANFPAEDGDCLVCGANHFGLRLNCDVCGVAFVTMPDNPTYCPNSHPISLESLCAQLGLNSERAVSCITCAEYLGANSSYHQIAGGSMFCLGCLQACEHEVSCETCGRLWAGYPDFTLKTCAACTADGDAPDSKVHKGPHLPH